jgi:hypothetical protein
VPITHLPGNEGLGWRPKVTPPCFSTSIQGRNKGLQRLGANALSTIENASSERTIDPAFARFIQQGVNAIFVAADAYFTALPRVKNNAYCGPSPKLRPPCRSA